MHASVDDELELLSLAERAATAAAGELLERFGGAAAGVRSKSTATDLVSDADIAAEDAVRRVIGEHRPGDAIIGEEGGASARRDPGALRWFVDPLDGTVNFLFGIPVFAVSIACEDEAGTVAGVVLDPVRDERFTATRSGEARCNGAGISSSSRDELSTAMVATGFSYDADIRARQAAVLGAVLPRVRDIRRAGAAAIDLCWTAHGRYDAYYERGLHPWDVAAGELIAQRAGLAVRKLEEGRAGPSGVVVAPPAIIEELYELVAGDPGL